MSVTNQFSPWIAQEAAALGAKLLLLTSGLIAITPGAAQAEDISAPNARAGVNASTQLQEIDRIRAWQTKTQGSDLASSAVTLPAKSDDQIATIQQFTDIQPSDWAYQALANLIQRYGCVAGYPNGTFLGKKPISRHEAAALLNACLDRVTETTDELKALLKLLEDELVKTKSKTSQLASRVKALETQQFSPTTKLKGLATYVIGGNNYSGSAINPGGKTVNRRTGKAVTLPTAATFNYDIQLTLDTSFSGKDLLRTNLRSGNFQYSAFGGYPHELSNQSQLLIAFDESNSAPDRVDIDKLYYQFPIGNGFTATLGPRVGQENMLALWPSVYPSDGILNVMAVNGAPAAYNKNRGAGFGLWWEHPSGLSVSANYVANNGSENSTGLFTSTSGSSSSFQIAYAQEQWGLAAIASYVQPETEFVPGTTPTVHSSIDHTPSAETQAYGLSAYWQPLKSGWAPSVSLGYGFNITNYSAPVTTKVGNSRSWFAGLQWTDVFQLGNDFGLAVGQPVVATSLTNGSNPDDNSYIYETWYKIQLTDQISLTPAVFYISRPLGMRTPSGESFSQLGVLGKMSFRF